MFSRIPGLARRPSMESFVSPTGQTFDQSPGCVGNTRLRRLRSMSQLQQSRKSFPQISPLLVTRTATVQVRHKKLGWTTWTRQSLRLTKRTVSLHRYPDSDVLDIIVLPKVTHVERVSDLPCCLRIETAEDKTYHFAFNCDEELYNWLTDIHLGIVPYGKPTNVTHLLHVEPDRSNKQRLIGLPEDWKALISESARDSITQEIVEATLPEISFASYPDPIINFTKELPDYRPVTPDSELENEDEAVILQAQIATRPVTQRLLDLQPPASLKIITGDFYPPGPSSLFTASDDSVLTPLLTPDTTPLTPFRESPYRYRESDAQDLSGQIHKQTEWAAAHGGYADIWRAVWVRDCGVSLQVAVKVLRVFSQDEDVDAKIHKSLCKEVRVWHQLRHKNIVQMYGTCDGFGPFPSMVSAWYNNGNVNTYLRNLGDAGTVDRRLKLLTEVARGLNYLHTFAFPIGHDMTTEANIVHGDLKGANILVNDHGEAALADFGLSSVIAAAGNTAITSTSSGGSVRWMAPELVLGCTKDVRSKTCASDTYSYGSVILEIITGEHPYKDIWNNPQVINQLMQGHKPKRPSKPILNPGVWDLMERCWSSTPSDRPKMAFVLSRMEKFYNQRRRSATAPY